MEFENSKPIYLQVIDDIKRKMVMGVIPPGDKLPSVRDLALTYTINPNTASRVYREMEMMSLCSRFSTRASTVSSLIFSFFPPS